MKKSIIYRYLLIVILLCKGTWCVQPIKEAPEPWITIFVHGIVGLDSKTCLYNVFQFLTDQIANTTYAKAVEYMRADTFFAQNQAMQGLGLFPIDIKNLNKGYAAGAVARTYNHILSLCPLKEKPYYYTLGWSGLLSFKERHRDAQEFYRLLVDLINKMRCHGINPKIRLIGYSHGANICLNLARVQEEEPYTSMPLHIDELILLGAPIQRETEQLIDSPLFKKIYNFYSRSDNVQKKDMFSSQQFFSKRVFRNHREFTLPPSLTQVEVKMLIEKKRSNKKRKNRTQISKAANIRKKSVVKGYSWSLKNMSPGHTELWFMAWTPRNYRDNFPLYPVPIACITPYIIQLIETSSPPPTTSRRIVVDIRPDHNYMIIKYRYPKRKFIMVSFLSKNVFDELTALAMPNKPDNYTPEKHDKHRADAKAKAYAHRKEQCRLRRLNKHKTSKI